jgi:DNA-binding response OmpR family regulator
VKKVLRLRIISQVVRPDLTALLYICASIANKASTTKTFDKARNPVAKILICEDDELYCQIAEAAFAGGGHDVLFASNGRQALNHLKTTEVDLVVTDLVMPDKDGLEVIRSIREKNALTPILAMTAGLASLKEPLLVAATALGANDVIQKPFRPAALRERVDALLAKAEKDQKSLAV